MSVETSQIRLEVPRSLKALCVTMAQVQEISLPEWVAVTLAAACVTDAAESEDLGLIKWSLRASGEVQALRDQ